MNASRRIGVLGGTGFVGRALAERLSAEGHEPVVISRNRSRNALRYLPPDVAAREIDVYDAHALAAALAGCEAAINLVGVLNDPRPGDGDAGFVRAHVELTGILIAACERAGIGRLLHMSSLNAGRGRSHYLRTRGQAEERVKASRLDWTTFQPSVIFGPGDGLFCRFAALLRLAPALPLARGGAKFAPVYIGDVVEAFIRALREPASVRQTYELYGPETITLAQIVRMTAHACGLRRLVVPLPDVLGRMQAFAMDFVPGKPFSSDNYRSLLLDAVGGIDGLHRLGIAPTRIAAVLPDILGHADTRQHRLDRYRNRR
ncbi:MAG: NAD(P)H-binding protein [Proteobacteria bacterium]|nr:NAD(P)H-binding protein [Pseudomonadota bacterium]